MATKPTRNRLLDQQHRNAAGSDINERRRSGRTTQMALAFIAVAMSKPNQPVKVTDHHDPESPRSKRIMLDACREVVGKLGLQFIDFSSLDYTVTCNLLEW